MQQAVNERIASQKYLEEKIEETIKEKVSCKDSYEQRYSKYKEKIHDLEAIIEQVIISEIELLKKSRILL